MVILIPLKLTVEMKGPDVSDFHLCDEGAGKTAQGIGMSLG